MGLRFRKSFKIAPGVRMNLGLRGGSLSFGGKAGRWTVGTSGTSASVAIPGTGFSYGVRSSTGGGSQRPANAEMPSGSGDVGVRIALAEDGTLSFATEGSSVLPPKLVAQVFAQHGETVREWLENYAQGFNADNVKLAKIHEDTPAPEYRSRFERVTFVMCPPEPPVLSDFAEPQPQRPDDKRAGLIARIIPGGVNRHEQKQAGKVAAFEEQHAKWQEGKIAHEESQQRLKAEHEAELARWTDLKELHRQGEENRAAEHEYRLLTDLAYAEEFLAAELAKLAE